MKGKFTAVLFILIFILIAAAVFTVLSGLDRVLPAPPTPTPVNGTTVVPADSATAPYIVPGSVSTADATPPPIVILTATPVLPPTAPPTPTPLPTTAPTTVPVQTTLTSGSFSSQTGTWLNITADWSVVGLDQNRVTVTVNVSATSFALHYSAFPKTLNISLDGQYVSLDPASITYDGKEQAVSPLGTTNFTVELPANSSKAMTLQVEWQFNGEMGGPNGRMVLPTIECGGIINVTR